MTALKSPQTKSDDELLRQGFLAISMLTNGDDDSANANATEFGELGACTGVYERVSCLQEYLFE